MSRWHNYGSIDGVSVGATYTYDNLGRLKTYTPGLPSGYGTISYTYNSIGQKTSMTVPLGAGNKAEKIDYYYDHYGRMVGTDVTSATVTSSSSLSSTTANETQFYYDDNQNRVKMVTKTNNPATYDGTYYFVYDPTAPSTRLRTGSIPAVVYEQGPWCRYLNIREPRLLSGAGSAMESPPTIAR